MRNRASRILSLFSATALSLGTASGAAAQSSDFPRFAQQHASDFGVSVEEATRRLQLADRLGDLQQELTKNEGSTFAGLIIEHIPSHRVVVRFTPTARPALRQEGPAATGAASAPASSGRGPTSSWSRTAEGTRCWIRAMARRGASSRLSTRCPTSATSIRWWGPGWSATSPPAWASAKTANSSPRTSPASSPTP